MYEYVTINNIDQEQAWSMIMGQLVQVGKSYLYRSPFRVDRKPSCWFQWYDSKLRFIDFSDAVNNHIDCVNAWMKLRNISYHQSLSELYYKQKGEIIYKPKEHIEHEPKVITISEHWEQRHTDFWRLRGVEKSDKLKGVRSYTINYGNYEKTWIPEDLCFAYECEGLYKLYFPNRDKPRFISNTTANCVWRYGNNSDTLLVTKSHKEFLILETVVPWDLTMVQSEPAYKAMVDEILSGNYKRVIIFYDNDNAGITNGLDFAKMVGGELIFIPTGDTLYSPYLSKSMLQYCDGFNSVLTLLGRDMSEYRGLKDVDDYVLKFGKKDLLNFIQLLTD